MLLFPSKYTELFDRESYPDHLFDRLFHRTTPELTNRTPGRVTEYSALPREYETVFTSFI